MPFLQHLPKPRARHLDPQAHTAAELSRGSRSPAAGGTERGRCAGTLCADAVGHCEPRGPQAPELTLRVIQLGFHHCQEGGLQKERRGRLGSGCA